MDESTKAKSRSLRRSQTEAETLLWKHLRDRRLCGHKFRRQHPFSPYIADFYCAEKSLIVELDGSQHLQQKEYDTERTRFLNAKGNTVLRFWNDEVLKNINGVLKTISEVLSGSE
jgi:very-short-patch-repair endonuclease